MQERIYEVDILLENTIADGVVDCTRGVAIISDLGITLKDADGNIIICFDTVDIKRDGYDFFTYNDENKLMTEDQLKQYWDVNIDVTTKMIKRGVFSTSTFNSIVDNFIDKTIGMDFNDTYWNNGGSGYNVPENACPHF